MNSPTTLRAVLNIFNKIKEKNPSLKYFCDPGIPPYINYLCVTFKSSW
jgi:pyridoxal/pyridoxine/pyridoxamine kinase